MRPLRDLIRDLEAWTLEGSDFHRDRQLADECLLADGWRVEVDVPGFPGAVWTWGTSPKILMADAHRSHPINDLNVAVGMIPFKHDYTINAREDLFVISVWPRDSFPSTVGRSSRLQVAIIIAALKQKLPEGERW